MLINGPELDRLFNYINIKFDIVFKINEIYKILEK